MREAGYFLAGAVSFAVFYFSVIAVGVWLRDLVPTLRDGKRRQR